METTIQYEKLDLNNLKAYEVFIRKELFGYLSITIKNIKTKQIKTVTLPKNHLNEQTILRYLSLLLSNDEFVENVDEELYQELINVDDFIQQEQFPNCYQCPCCETDLGSLHMKIIMNYPNHGYFKELRPNQKFAIGFECSNCQEKSFMIAQKHEITLFWDSV